MYHPSSILASAGLDPGAVCAACGLDDPDRVPVRAAPRWLIRVWVGPVAAMTVPWAIYVHPDLLGGERQALAALVEHEMVHVGQWQRLGVARFLLSYAGDYLRGRLRGLSHWQAYQAVRLEAEARRVVDGRP